jgi:tape measure domain-containing protein
MAYDKATLGEIVYYVLCKNDTATGVNSAIRDLKRLDAEAMRTLNNIRDGYSKGMYSYNTMIQMMGNELSTSYTRATKASNGFTSAMGGVSKGSSLLTGIVAGLTAMFAYQLVGAIEGAISSMINFGISLASTASQAAGEMEKIQIAFTTLLGSSEAAAAQIQNMWNFAIKSPFHFEDVAQGTKMLLAYGFAADEVEQVLRDTGDAAAALGQDSQGYERMLYAIGQVKAFGALRGQETMQLVNAGVPIWEILRNATGLQGEDLRKAVEERGITGDQALGYIFEFMRGRYGGAMEQMNKTTPGQISQLQDEFQLLFIKAGAGINQILLPILQELNRFVMDNLIPTVEKLVADFTELITPDVINGFVWLVETGLMGILSFANSVSKTILGIMDMVGKLSGYEVPTNTDSTTPDMNDPDNYNAAADGKPVSKELNDAANAAATAAPKVEQFNNGFDKTISVMDQASAAMQQGKASGLDFNMLLTQLGTTVDIVWTGLVDIVRILWDLIVIIWNVINYNDMLIQGFNLVVAAINLVVGAIGVILTYLRVFLDALANTKNDLIGTVTDIFKVLMGIFAKFGADVIKFIIKLAVDISKFGLDVGYGFANAIIDGLNWGAEQVRGIVNTIIGFINSIKIPAMEMDVLGQKLSFGGWGGFGLREVGPLTPFEHFDNTEIKAQLDRGLQEAFRIFDEQFNAGLKALGWDMTLQDFAKKYGIDLGGNVEDVANQINNTINNNPNLNNTGLTNPVDTLTDTVNDLKDTVSGKKMESNINLYFDVHIENAGNQEEVQNAGTVLQNSVMQGLWQRGLITTVK